MIDKDSMVCGYLDHAGKFHSSAIERDEANYKQKVREWEYEFTNFVSRSYYGNINVDTWIAFLQTHPKFGKKSRPHSKPRITMPQDKEIIPQWAIL